MDETTGFLHLKITKVKNRWYCAEVVSTDWVGYGTYTWELASPVDNLDRNVVLGLFTWSTTSEYANGEIDIEFARWGSRTTELNAQFVVQPFDLPAHMVRYSFPPGYPETTHSFLWSDEGVLFESLLGHWISPPPSTAVVLAWPFVPAEGDFWPQPTGSEHARMNLWLYQGAKPSDGLQVEVVVKSFTYEAEPMP